MKDYNVIIKIGTTAMTDDEALDQYSDILFFIQDNLPSDNFIIQVEEVGEYM